MYKSKIYCLVALAAFSGQAAFADVTPQIVWDDFQQMMMSLGMPVEADVNDDGDRLVVSNLRYSFEMDKGSISSVSATIVPEIVFKDIGGGKVEITYPQPLQSTSDVIADPALDMPAFEQTSTMSFVGSTIAEGDKDNIIYVIENVQLAMTSDPVLIEGETIQPGGTMTMGPISGNYRSQNLGDMLMVTLEAKADTLTYDMDSFGQGGSDNSAQMASGPITMAGTFALKMDEASATSNAMERFLESDMDFNYSFEDVSYAVNVVSPDTGPLNIEGTSGEATLSMEIAGGQLTYGGSAVNTDVVIGGAMIPGIQAQIGIGNYGAEISLPVKASADEPVPVGIKLALEELKLPDIAWMMLDPAGQLPHDPATLRLDLQGTATTSVGLFDLEKLMGMSPNEAAPFEMKTATLNELFASLAGAKIEGAGGWTFVDGPAALPGGMPPFAGNLNVKLSGVMTLMEKLSAVGILPAEQAMGARMMIGILARPGEGDDVFISDIEMRENGEILANGAPLPF